MCNAIFQNDSYESLSCKALNLTCFSIDITSDSDFISYLSSYTLSSSDLSLGLSLSLDLSLSSLFFYSNVLSGTDSEMIYILSNQMGV
jgi:hypothetical protein